MADDREMVLRFLDMVRGSLDEKNTRLLEELRLKRLIVLGGQDRDPDKPVTPQVENDQKGTDKPWELPGQSSQQPAQKPPPKPDYENPKRKTARDVAPSPGPLLGRARSVA
jgi:hypothetical protein